MDSTGMNVPALFTKDKRILEYITAFIKCNIKIDRCEYLYFIGYQTCTKVIVNHAVYQCEVVVKPDH